MNSVYQVREPHETDAWTIRSPPKSKCSAIDCFMWIELAEWLCSETYGNMKPGSFKDRQSDPLRFLRSQIFGHWQMPFLLMITCWNPEVFGHEVKKPVEAQNSTGPMYSLQTPKERIDQMQSNWKQGAAPPQPSTVLPALRHAVALLGPLPRRLTAAGGGSRQAVGGRGPFI